MVTEKINKNVEYIKIVYFISALFNSNDNQQHIHAPCNITISRDQFPKSVAESMIEHFKAKVLQNFDLDIQTLKEICEDLKQECQNMLNRCDQRGTKATTLDKFLTSRHEFKPSEEKDPLKQISEVSLSAALTKLGV